MLPLLIAILLVGFLRNKAGKGKGEGSALVVRCLRHSSPIPSVNGRSRPRNQSPTTSLWILKTTQPLALAAPPLASAAQPHQVCNVGQCEGSWLERGYPTTVRAEIITELILERAGPVIFKTVLLELVAFRLIPVNFLQEEASLKTTGNDS